MFLKMLHAAILITIFAAVKGDNACIQHYVGENAMVCVCNSTYCDTIDDLPKLQVNQYVCYTSTRDGERLQRSINNFIIEPDPVKNPVNTYNEGIFIVDSSVLFQKMHGFGGAMTDATAINIRSLSNNTQHNLLESYYGKSGIGYTHCRIPIAGTDFSTRPYTYDDISGDLTLSNFSLVEEDDYKIGYLHEIRRIMSDPDSLRIFTTSWSAPAWMKTTNDIKWGFLRPIYYQLYADYIKKFFDAYDVRGINIWGITPGNEPIDGLIPVFPFNAMAWDPKSVTKWIVDYLQPTLNMAGYNPIYMALDDQRFELPWYVDVMFNNSKCKEIFSGIAFHWYADAYFSPLRLDETHVKYPDKFLLMSEACAGSEDTHDVILGSWDRGEKYMFDIIQDILHWTTGWIDWNMALDEQGGPNWAKNFVDSPIIVNSTNDEFYKQPMYYALAHVSKFVPRDSYRIFSTGLESNPSLQGMAFLTPELEIVIVIANKDENPYNMTIKDKKAVYKKMKLHVPAKSFNTLIYSL